MAQVFMDGKQKNLNNWVSRSGFLFPLLACRKGVGGGEKTIILSIF